VIGNRSQLRPGTPVTASLAGVSAAQRAR